MKTAIVYYSMLGNTEYVAEQIKSCLGDTKDMDVIQIEPQKAYPDKGAMKFFWGGKSAVMGEKPKLVPYKFDVGNYDRIILGTPVWASNFAPPLRTFLHENPDISKKEIAVFACCSGDGKKAIDRLKKYLGIDGFKAEMILIDPKDKPDTKNLNIIKEFCEKIS